MAPNLRELCLRRMKISNRAFICIASELRRLERIDISDCNNIQENGLKILIDNNKYLTHIQANNIPTSMTNEVI